MLVNCRLGRGILYVSVRHEFFSEIPIPMAARTMKLVANSLIKLANLVDAKVHVKCLYYSDNNNTGLLHCLEMLTAVGIIVVSV